MMDQQSFHVEFNSFQAELKSYLLRITGSREDAEDFAHDTYIKACNKIDTFKGNSSIKTWVFSIATNLTRDHFRSKKRWSVSCQDNAREDALENPEIMQRLIDVGERSNASKFEIKEHIDFCFTCIAKTLPTHQQLGLILKDVYNFKVHEITQIMDMTEGKVKHAIADARNTLTRIFEKRCALVNKGGACHQCSELNGILNPKQNQQERLLQLNLKKEAEAGQSADRLLELRLELVRGIDPLNAAGTDLHSFFLELMPDYSETPTGV